MSVSVELRSNDVALLNRVMNQWAEQTGQTLREVLPAEMRLFAAGLAAVTTPKDGKSNDLTGQSKTKAKGAGHIKNMNKVRGTVGNIYPSIGHVVNMIKEKNPGAAGSFAAAMQKRNYAKAQKVINSFIPEMNITIKGFDGGNLHRLQGGKKITQRILAPSQQAVNAYANKAAKKVGYAKGGFATAARQLGGVRGIPGYATRQKSPGTGSITGDGKTLTVTMTNDVKYAHYALLPHDEDSVEKFRVKMVTVRLKRVQDRKVRAAMRNFQ